jgi:hypothetical protein
MPSQMLRHRRAVLAAAAFLLVPRASDPVGVYAVVDRVVMAPDAANPTSIQLWGTFALTTGEHGARGDTYQPAQRGYLYYSVNNRNTRATIAEWSDLRAAAGTGQVIGFGSRFAPPGHVRRGGEPASGPDEYPLGFGLVRLISNPLGASIQRDLLNVPAPVSPTDGDQVRAGPIRLAVRNVADSGARYVFEIVGSGSARETSLPIAAGRGQTEWTPQLRLVGGEQYTWRVWVVNGDWRGQPAISTFRVARQAR